nr:hypothetical protein 348p1_00129 [Serratia grimesii]
MVFSNTLIVAKLCKQVTLPLKLDESHRDKEAERPVITLTIRMGGTIDVGR